MTTPRAPAKKTRRWLIRGVKVLAILILLLIVLIYLLFVWPFWGIPFNQSRHGPYR
jgi:hypothetical protein